MGKKAETPADDLIEITVDSDTHTHEGRLCVRGEKIAVGKPASAMLERVWAKQKKAE